MAIVRDASSPARFNISGNGTGTETGTSASFTPPANSVLVVYAAINSFAGASPTFNNPTFSGTGVGTFAVAKSQVNATGGSVCIWRAATTGTPSAGTISISVTNSGSNQAVVVSAGWVDVWTGADSTQTSAATGGTTSTTQNISPTVTTTRNGSRVAGVGVDWSALGAPTSSDTIDSYTVVSQTSGGRAFKAANSGAAGSVALNFVAGGAGPIWSVALLEILAANGAGAKRAQFSPGKLALPTRGKFRVATRAFSSTNTDVTVSLSGSSFAFSAGTLTPSIDKALTGQSYAWTAGILTPNTSVSLAGQSYAYSAGTVSPNTAISLTGSLESYSTGTLTPSTDIALAGATYAWNTGTLTASTGGDVTVALSGTAIALSAGILTANSSIALTGSAETYSTGTLVANTSLALTGIAEAYSSGVLSPSTSISLNGSLVSFSSGTLTAQVAGDVTVALTGIDMAFSAGQMQASGADSAQQPSGGFFYDFDHYRAQKQRRKEREKELEREAKEIQAEIDRDIAKLLHAQEAKDAERADLARIQALADQYAGTKQPVPRSIAATLLKAQEERSKNALEQLQREMSQLIEAEEIAAITLILFDDED